MGAAETVPVGPFAIADVSRSQLTAALVAQWARAQEPVRVFALHVGGLNCWRDQVFVRQLRDAEWLYADGAAVVLVARGAGAADIQRAPTTDLAHLVLDEVGRQAGRAVRIALVGGPPGLAERAARRLEGLHAVRTVVTSDGFREDWIPLLTELREQRPDVVFVGMGMPQEAAWVTEHLSGFPAALVMTCGGWFGFLAGEESRAPAVLQRHGAEWLWRLLQSPRLLPRYAQGVLTTARMLVTALAVRAGRRRRRAAS
jgi:N-acetylglucosaminyldiphosphoundecaprenol N-acetyl-beta-D-mannosaminyltransferase